jgi:hypothetical protein
MPYTTKKVGKNKVQVRSPNGIKSKGSTPENAKRQVRLLRGIENGWKPTGAPARDEMKKRVMKKY